MWFSGGSWVILSSRSVTDNGTMEIWAQGDSGGSAHVLEVEDVETHSLCHKSSFFVFFHPHHPPHPTRCSPSNLSQGVLRFPYTNKAFPIKTLFLFKQHTWIPIALGHLQFTTHRTATIIKQRRHAEFVPCVCCRLAIWNSGSTFPQTAPSLSLVSWVRPWKPRGTGPA